MTTAGIWEQNIIISFGYILSISNFKVCDLQKYQCFMINATVIVISRCASSIRSNKYVLEIFGRLWYR